MSHSKPRNVSTLSILALLASAACAAGGPAVAPLPVSAPGRAGAWVLWFSYAPRTAGQAATDVAIWFAADKGGALSAVRSTRTDSRSGRVLQETSFQRDGATYTIVDHEACRTDPEVEPPSGMTADELIRDSIGPLDLKSPTDLDDGQVRMRVEQPSPDLSSRTVRLFDTATGEEMALIDGIGLASADPSLAVAPLKSLRCVPKPTPSE